MRKAAERGETRFGGMKKDHVELFRAVILEDYELTSERKEKAVQGEPPLEERDVGTRYPNLKMPRNGASSWTLDADVANGWQGGGVPLEEGTTRVVLRAKVPYEAIFSAPQFGKNVQAEQEYVLSSAPPKSWTAWESKAPVFTEWDEADHPRGPDGKFIEKPGGAERSVRMLVAPPETLAFTLRAFCATGEGGGIDNSCGYPKNSGMTKADLDEARKVVERDMPNLSPESREQAARMRAQSQAAIRNVEERLGKMKRKVFPLEELDGGIASLPDETAKAIQGEVEKLTDPAAVEALTDEIAASNVTMLDKEVSGGTALAHDVMVNNLVDRAEIQDAMLDERGGKADHGLASGVDFENPRVIRALTGELPESEQTAANARAALLDSNGIAKFPVETSLLMQVVLQGEIWSEFGSGLDTDFNKSEAFNMIRRGDIVIRRVAPEDRESGGPAISVEYADPDEAPGNDWAVQGLRGAVVNMGLLESGAPVKWDEAKEIINEAIVSSANYAIDEFKLGRGSGDGTRRLLSVGGLLLLR
jgi:hypothetical protein